MILRLSGRRSARLARVVRRRYRAGVRNLFVFLGLLAVLAAGTPARGDEPPLPMGIPDVVGARGLALGAYRGLAGGNDGIFGNAAGLAARKRYAIETQWLLDRSGSSNELQFLGASVVDSEGGVTGGFAYTRVLSGPWTGNLFHLPIAFPLGERFFLGVTGKYQSLDGPMNDQMRAANFDASAFWQPSSFFSVGGSIYNVLDAGHQSEQPRAYAAGAAIGDDRSFHLLVDWRGDTQRQGKLTNLYAVGGEVLVSDVVPLRASYVNDATRNASFWSAGAGVVSTSGVAVDATYRQCIERSDERIFAVGLKFFVLSQ
jgi:hypothetical protein